MNGIIWSEECTQTGASFLRLTVSFGGEFHSVIGDSLMDFSVLVSF